jgi:FkbM family methyltransferase
VYWRGWDGYESETARVFYAHAQRARVVLDVGAHVGYFTVLGALANAQARVFAFEPNPTVYQRLARNIALNGLTNAEAIPNAAGRKSAAAEFYFVPEGIPANSSLSLDYISTCDQVLSTTVGVVAIDDFLAARGIDCVDLVKLDTETTEADVLEGMARTLERCRPVILCEILSPTAERRIHDLLDPLGYQARMIAADGRNYLFEPRG